MSSTHDVFFSILSSDPSRKHPKVKSAIKWQKSKFSLQGFTVMSKFHAGLIKENGAQNCDLTLKYVFFLMFIKTHAFPNDY